MSQVLKFLDLFVPSEPNHLRILPKSIKIQTLIIHPYFFPLIITDSGPTEFSSTQRHTHQSKYLKFPQVCHLLLLLYSKAL